MKIILLCTILLGLMLLILFLLLRFNQLKKEVKDKNAALLRAQDQLILQEKMGALGHLTAGIAHEIKNPLNFVNNFAEGSFEICEELSLEFQKYQTIIETQDYNYLMDLLLELKQNALDIRSHGRRIDQIVRSIMNHARGSNDIRQTVNINLLVEENVSLAYHGYRAIEPSFDVKIQYDYDPAIEPVSVIRQDVGRVLLNIINNACYALSQKKKEIQQGYQPKLSVRTKWENEAVEIHISDNGPGIPSELRDQIFKPFFTTKPIGEGNTGLGLSISRDIIVERHHGQLKVESEPGKFTEFIIILPKAS